MQGLRQTCSLHNYNQEQNYFREIVSVHQVRIEFGWLAACFCCKVGHAATGHRVWHFASKV
jgi:hypothetical protein